MTPEEYRLLLHIDSPEDLKRLSAEELRAYCDELRRYIVDECSVNPGHLASSLGAVELAAAAALEEKGLRADLAAGFSLGEIGALAYTGAVEQIRTELTKAGFQLVTERV